MALVWLIMSLAPLAAQTPITVAARSSSAYWLGPWAELLEDETRVLTIDDVADGPASERFRPNLLGSLNVSNSRSAWWIRIPLQTSDEPGVWLLEIADAQLETLTLYSRRPDASWAGMTAGIAHPFRQWPVDHRYVVFPLEASGDRPTVYYLRITSLYVTAPLWLWSKPAFDRYARDSYAALSLFYGAIGLLTVYGLFLAWLLRDPAYFWFALFTAAVGGVLAFHDGLTFQYVIPLHPEWSDPARHVPSLVVVWSLTGFTQSFFATAREQPLVHRVLQIDGGLIIALTLAELAGLEPLPYDSIIQLLISSVLVAAVLVATVVAWRRGHASARYVTLAIVLGSVGFTVWVVAALEGFPVTLVTKYSAHAGLLAYSTVLAFALAARVREMSLTRERARSAAREAEARAATAEAASRAKSEVLADMSHQIRTPLNAIIGFTQLLGRGAALGAADLRALRNIENGGERLLTVVDDVLDLAKVEARRVDIRAATFDVGQTLAELEVMFQPRCAEKGVRWKLAAVGVGSQLVVGDEDKLSQVLGVLLSNAVKFTDAGEVCLTARRTQSDRYQFEVTDSGIGIPAADRARIFEPFGQTAAGADRGGAGIGLSIARRLLELMDGTLALHPSSGSGSSFVVELRLPIASAALPSVSAPVQWRAAPGQSVAALVVDDDPASREVLRALLEDLGVEVADVADGQRALEAAERARPDVVFMDIRLPGEDGEIWARRMWSALGSELTVVATSASVLAHQRARYVEAGFNAILEKPILAHRLATCMAELFGGGESRDAGQPASVAGEWTKVRVPAALMRRLRGAAELASITDLKRQIDELARLGTPPAKLLASQLRASTDAFDMGAVLATLQRVAAADQAE